MKYLLKHSIINNLKSLVIIMLILSSLLFSGCFVAKQITKTESSKNIREYIKKGSEICGVYGFIKIDNPILFDKTISDDNIEVEQKIYFEKKGHEIELDYYNLASKSENAGDERFRITYIKSDKNSFDYDIILSLSNDVSGKEIQKDFLIEFLNSSDNGSQSSQNNYTDIVYQKSKNLDFMENWIIEHTVYKDGNESLMFTGLTKSIESD